MQNSTMLSNSNNSTTSSNTIKNVLRRTPGYPFISRSYYQVHDWGNTFHVLRRRFLLSSKIIRNYLQFVPVPKLHIGSGMYTLPGWLNADIAPQNDAICFLDATKRFPFTDSTFAYIFSEHMMEHIPYLSGRHMLVECFRVLKPGGRIRISTPDLNFLFQLFQTEHSTLQAEYLAWSINKYWSLPERHPALVINNFFYSWGHRFIYDEATLRQSMEIAGFQDIRRVEIGKSNVTALCGLENENRFPSGFIQLESMVIEASKQ